MNIPVIHCFDNRYVIPASVAFYSMLEHADSQHIYKLYVMHTDITLKNQQKLQSIVGKFSNASLKFINMENKFSDLFNSVKSKAHFSKEMFYKLIVPNVFKEYDFAIVTDVDVVYKGDISIEYMKFVKTNDYFIGGIRYPKVKGTWLEKFEDSYNKFPEDERNKIRAGVGAGYLIYNLKLMRQENVSQKLVEYVFENYKKIIQPEQDALNLCLYNRIFFCKFVRWYVRTGMI